VDHLIFKHTILNTLPDPTIFLGKRNLIE